MIDSIVISWNPLSEQYFMTIMNVTDKIPVTSHRANSIEEVLDIIHLKVTNETECKSRDNN